MKKLAMIRSEAEHHWVGDGFPVRSIFTYNDIAAQLSPFLLLDYAGPVEFAPTEQRRGVGEHPHRGFETVTIVYSGQVEHRDSSGGGGVIGAGDVQWMTAAAGIVHEEFHGQEFSKRGGAFEVIQLWVNLPAKHKMSPPRYQAIQKSQIPVVALPADRGHVRVIAGKYQEADGPARTFTPMNVWDVHLHAGHVTAWQVPEHHTTALFVLKGRVALAAGEIISEAQLAVLGRSGREFTINALEDAVLLVLNGEPIDEPVVGYGPFVMNTHAQIQEAIADYRGGRMGKLAARD